MHVGTTRGPRVFDSLLFQHYFLEGPRSRALIAHAPALSPAVQPSSTQAQNAYVSEVV